MTLLAQSNLNRRDSFKQTGLLGLATGLAGKLQGATPARAASKFDSILAKYPKLPPAPAGKGNFAHVSSVLGGLRHEPQVVAA